MKSKVKNLVGLIIFLILTIVLPVRNLLFVKIPEGARGDSFKLTSYVMLFLFASLTLVFLFRLVSKKGAK